MTELAKDVADLFPHAEVGPFQDQFIKTIFTAVEEGCSVAIEGSNGPGKTIAALSACRAGASNLTGASALFQKSFLNDAKSIGFSSSMVGISFMFLSSLIFPMASTLMSLETGVDIFTVFLR